MLRKRLKVEEYERETPFEPLDYEPARVRLPLKQHAGQPAVPVVKEGRRVKRGDVIARVPEGQLGADVHASIGGKVQRITAQEVEIVA
jgi:Na+-translocating ferredoxin:NAD+ oxidoreductase RnfC subunit